MTAPNVHAMHAKVHNYAAVYCDTPNNNKTKKIYAKYAIKPPIKDKRKTYLDENEKLENYRNLVCQ